MRPFSFVTLLLPLLWVTSVSAQTSGSQVTPVSQSGTWTVNLGAALPAGSNLIGSVGISGTVPVTGTFWQATQPVSNAGTFAVQDVLAEVRLANIVTNTAGVATAAKQPALSSDGGALAHILNFPTTQAISAASLPLPSGAATAANQVGGTSAGTSASMANPVQGVTDGIPLVTAPVSAVPVACGGGSGTSVTTVGTSSSVVCAAATSRTWWRISNANPTGGGGIYCTDDGSAVSLTHWNFVVYAGGYTTSEPNFTSSAAISCIASATSMVAANAVQTGAP